jgi:hypothetical protein
MLHLKVPRITSKFRMGAWKKTKQNMLNRLSEDLVRPQAISTRRRKGCAPAQTAMGDAFAQCGFSCLAKDEAWGATVV